VRRFGEALKTLLLVPVDEATNFGLERYVDTVRDSEIKQAQSRAEALVAVVEELRNISSAKHTNFLDAEEFRSWARNRAQHALAKYDAIAEKAKGAEK
jgi:hypothetical protein